MTKELLNLFELCSKKGLNFQYHSMKPVSDYAVLNKEKKTVYVNISDPNDAEKMKKIKGEIEKVMRELSDI